MIKLETLHETNVAGSNRCLAYHLFCFLRSRRAHFEWNGIPPAAAAQMADDNMAIVPQIRVAFIDRAKVNEVVLFHLFTSKYLFSRVQFLGST
jgi:hypothetical protein